ncbi:hypothetical protein LTR84_004700 [Exophiala bonariae]|uniref:Uncharacterized protein n=1 Tax=Exophiala bonariae TaxID=1690606 RepID=A0AAV9NQ58_9EURO|nr:hypothetical protein LTR84_004700 [Exophiala bonariae]
MCLTKITYYACGCFESKREIWCPLPRPACPEKLKYPETRTLAFRCPQHDTLGFNRKRGSPTEAERWSPIRPNSMSFQQQPLENSSLYLATPDLHSQWSALPNIPPPSSSRNSRSGNGSGSGNGQRRQSKPLTSARIEDALNDFKDMNMPVRNRESMVGLYSLREHEAEQMAADAPPVPSLPPGFGNTLQRTNNATKSHHRRQQNQHQPTHIDTSMWHSSTKRTHPQRQNSGGVTKPFSPKSRISPRTAALAQQQAKIRAYREALTNARRWAASVHGPWTADAFFNQPWILALNGADREMLWSELRNRLARGEMQRDRLRWGRGGHGADTGSAHQGYTSNQNQMFEDQGRERRFGRSKRSNRKVDSSSGCRVM